MKTKRIIRIATALAIASAASLLVGCGQSNSIPISPLAAGINPYGAYGSGACVPVASQIPFTAQGAYMDSANILMGMIPGSGQPYGTVIVGSGAPGPYERSGPAVDGILSMNILPMTTGGMTTLPGYPSTYPVGYPTGYATNPNSVTITGTIQIAPATQEDIAYQEGSVLGLPGTTMTTTGYPGTTTSICVSNIAINSGHNGYQIYSATTYAYLNGTQHGYVLAL